MRETHMEQVERWAEFIRENPDKWRVMHSKFINSIYTNQARVYRTLAKTPQGKKKLIELYSIRNLEGFPSLK